jgi:probable F420-dependent oxidoreductase
MRVGLVTPVVTLNPRFINEWERVAGPDAIAAVAELADRLGFHHVTASEHAVIREDMVPVRGSSYWDPAATLGYIAGRTSRIRLATHVLVLGFHHPLVIAKRFGTLDRLSGGRLILGVGVGSAPEEFELLGLPWEDRGMRADDAIKALRACLSNPRGSYHGTHYDFEGWVMEPAALQQRVPIWIGGRSPRSLRRAIELGDGWAPQGAGHAEFAEMLARARESDAYAAREYPLEILLTPSPRFDPVTDAGNLGEEIVRLNNLGATMLNVRMRHRSLEHCLEQLHAFREVAQSTGVVEFEG